MASKTRIKFEFDVNNKHNDQNKYLRVCNYGNLVEFCIRNKSSWKALKTLFEPDEAKELVLNFIAVLDDVELTSNLQKVKDLFTTEA